MKNKEPENDVPKYKKKTKSNCSKSKSKSDHKHQNKDCLLIADSKPYLASYCTVCGKIRSWNYCLEKCEGGYKELFDEEAFKKYKDLEQMRRNSGGYWRLLYQRVARRSYSALLDVELFRIIRKLWHLQIEMLLKIICMLLRILSSLYTARHMMIVIL